ncbi:fatty acid synthase [Caerostris extrusa]|uniref:Fatty acid synthase n=1 Tax=Caerostris extrusa TaxID=172846 RepID=A0AAV4M7B6_CAEEX|nr:fatty acid synthase [Caerostris extrusa]
MYTEGLNPKVERLYPSVAFPVPRKTPMISNLIRWNHGHSFHVPVYSPVIRGFRREFHFDKEDSYLLEYKVGAGPSSLPQPFSCWRGRH